MKVKNKFIALSVFLAAGSAFAADNGHWTYSGHEGPEHWGALSSEYSTCAAGKNQSPINLTNMIEGELPGLNIKYKAGGGEIVNNGHTIQLNYVAGSSIDVGGHVFELKQFHFHSPSENTIEGQSYPMESHFVHADKDGNLAVIAVMLNVGEANAELDKAWKYMPTKAGEKHGLQDIVDASALLPSDRAYYRFNGSLTTPPCSEGVNWFVMKSGITASKEQINKFLRVMNQLNNRPVQPINARTVIQ